MLIRVILHPATVSEETLEKNVKQQIVKQCSRIAQKKEMATLLKKGQTLLKVEKSHDPDDQEGHF